jgi:hypothetical protein
MWNIRFIVLYAKTLQLKWHAHYEVEKHMPTVE